MKVLHILNNFLPEYTGSTIRPYNLLSRIPYKFNIITADSTMQGKKIEKKTEVYSKNLYVTRVNLTESSLYRYPIIKQYNSLFYNEKKIIQESNFLKYDIVHGHNISPFGKFAKKVSHLSNKPFILEIHSLEYVQGYLSRLFNYYMINLEKIFENVDHLIFLTESMQKYFIDQLGFSELKSSVISNGVDIKKFSKTQNNLKKAKKIKEDMGIHGKIVLYAGIIDKINGMDKILDYIDPFLSNDENITFIFIGHGPEAKKIISISKNQSKIRYVPMINHAEMADYYTLSDIFIIPRPSTISTETVTPLKLLEAMSMECVVLGSNVGGITDIIEDGKNGYIFDNRDPSDFKTKLKEIINKDNAKISKNARKTVLKNYTWDESANKLHNIYDSLV